MEKSVSTPVAGTIMHTPNPQELQRISLLLEAESSQLKKFLDLLEREETVLVSGDTDGLLLITKEKNERYRQLQHLHDDRSMLVGRFGRGKDDAAIRVLCAKMPKALAQWDEVLSLAACARERNHINGQLITKHMQHNQGALSVLLAAADHPQLYDAGGHSRPSGGGRMLGSA
ncbi:MAG: flagellar protein FlgN [Azoarcus sp.]|jgi:flagella synthesis protein FlgN|nr:flagellar protein FlgN [Azoarcus sp.]